jgi:hypothetical protein
MCLEFRSCYPEITIFGHLFTGALCTGAKTGRRTPKHFTVDGNMGVLRGVSKRVEDGRKPPALWEGHRLKGHKALSGVARPQGVEG